LKIVNALFLVISLVGFSVDGFARQDSSKTTSELTTNNASTPEPIVIWQAIYHDKYIQETLSNALDLTIGSHGDYNIISSNELSQEQAFEALKKGGIDLMIAAASNLREQTTSAIYIPLYRGLLGFRLCLVTKSSNLFDSVRTSQEFIDRGLSVGLGRSWPDSDVYRDNGFKVVLVDVYESLIELLRQQQFDCFSRGIFEVDDELTKYRHTGIKLDEHLIFIYPNANFIYVNVNNHKLKQRLNSGFQIAITDQSFYDIFNSHFSDILIKKGIYERHIFLMGNSRLTERASKAINKYGIASFVSTLQSSEDDDTDD